MSSGNREVLLLVLQRHRQRGLIQQRRPPSRGAVQPLSDARLEDRRLSG